MGRVRMVKDGKSVRSRWKVDEMIKNGDEILILIWYGSCEAKGLYKGL